jgi:hypothetical protein
VHRYVRTAFLLTLLTVASFPHGVLKVSVSLLFCVAALNFVSFCVCRLSRPPLCLSPARSPSLLASMISDQCVRCFGHSWMTGERCDSVFEKCIECGSYRKIETFNLHAHTRNGSWCIRRHVYSYFEQILGFELSSGSCACAYVYIHPLTFFYIFLIFCVCTFMKKSCLCSRTNIYLLRVCVSMCIQKYIQHLQ